MSRFCIGLLFAVIPVIVLFVSCEHAPQGPPNLILISLDTLRADHLGCYGYPRNTSPFIDSIAKEGIRFENAFVPIPSTDACHTSMLTSQHPLRHQLISLATVLDDSKETISEVLSANGYYTMGVVSVNHLGSQYGFNQGFNAFLDRWNPMQYDNDRHQRVAQSVHTDVEKLVKVYDDKHNDQPYFLFVHYFDCHTPYTLRAEFEPEESLDEAHLARQTPEIRRMNREYDSEIRYVDSYVGKLIRLLEKKKMLTNTLIVITSDHGEQLGEHGYSGGHADIYSENIRVPLIFWKNGMQSKVIENPVSIMDISTTMLSQCSLKFLDTIDGIDLSVWISDRNEPAPPHDDRHFHIMGYPQYTRSHELIDNNQWFIRNLESFYRYVFSISESTAMKEPVSTVNPSETGEKEFTYMLPLKPYRHEIEHYYVSIHFKLMDSSAPVETNIRLSPRLDYFEKPIQISSGTTLYIPLTNMDVGYLKVTQPDRVEQMAFGIIDNKQFHVMIGDISHDKIQKIQTKIYEDLLTTRASFTGNEMYFFDQDPKMMNNVFNLYKKDAQQLNEKLENSLSEFFKDRSLPESAENDLSDSEIDMLKSLGYL